VDFINFHIAYLLTKHECVTIPDFGAFVVSQGKEDVPRQRGFLSPPANRSLTFNPEIIQDDGLLVRSVAKEKSVSYTEALRLINDYVDKLVNALRKGETVQFSWVGKISLSYNRKIVFTPARSLSCNASNCGLVNLNFPSLTEPETDESTEKRRKRKRKTYKRPVFPIILAVIAIVLLLVGLFVFLVSKPLNKNWFSLPDMPTITMPAMTMPTINVPSMSDILKKINSKKPVMDTVPLISTDAEKPKIADSVEPAVADSIKSIIAESAELPPSKYAIIISSMKTEKEAKVMLNYFLAKGLDKSKIVPSDGKYRISIETFENKDEALSFLDMIKTDGGNPLFKDAWILEVSR